MNQIRCLNPFLLLPIVLSAGCGHLAGNRYEQEPAAVTAPAPRPHRAEYPELAKALNTLSGRVLALEDHLTYCPKDVRKLLDEVRRNCSLAQQTCSGQPIGMAIMKSDSTEQLRLLSMMHRFEHQAFYLPQSMRALLAEERRLLRDVVSPAWLDTMGKKTTFIVVSHPENDKPAAESRAKEWSLQFGEEIASIIDENAKSRGSDRNRTASDASSKPPVTGTTQGEVDNDAARNRRRRAEQLVIEGRIMHWIYGFSDTQERLSSDDAPRGKERLTRSVWVYRVNC